MYVWKFAHVCMYACMMEVCLFTCMHVCRYVCRVYLYLKCMYVWQGQEIRERAVCGFTTVDDISLLNLEGTGRQLCIYMTMYVCMYVCMHYSFSGCMYVCTCIYACICMFVCTYSMYVCMYVCVYVCSLSGKSISNVIFIIIFLY